MIRLTVRHHGRFTTPPCQITLSSQSGTGPALHDTHSKDKPGDTHCPSHRAVLHQPRRPKHTHTHSIHCPARSHITTAAIAHAGAHTTLGWTQFGHSVQTLVRPPCMLLFSFLSPTSEPHAPAGSRSEGGPVHGARVPASRRAPILGGEAIDALIDD